MTKNNEVNKHHFDSTSIEYAHHDPATKILSIKFVNGHEYKYADVDEDDFEAFKMAKSAGKHFQSHIKPRFKLVQ